MAEDGDEEVKYSILYEGDEEAGEYYTKDGKATVQYSSGDTYTGDLKDGKKTGKGVYVWKDANATYDGEWASGVRTGHGKFVYPDGSKYEGEWLNNTRNGKGTTIYTNGDSYCGEYQDGLRAGQGIYTYEADRSQLIGEWKNDTFIAGKWRYNDKTQFVGVFNGNTPNGNGVFTFPSSNQLHGVYQNGTFYPQSIVCNEV